MMLSKLIEEVLNNLDTILKYRNQYTSKEDGSYVSEGDLLIESMIFDFCQLTFPYHIVISEEMKDLQERDWNLNGNYVIVDPIDGTENFVSGLREWGVGISIYTHGIHESSCIMLPELNEFLVSGQKLTKYKSRIIGLSSSLNQEDLMELPNKGFEYRIIGCSMYNMLSAIKGSFAWFENIKGVNCWDILPGLNLALEHGLICYVNDKLYEGEILFPTHKYRIKIINP